MKLKALFAALAIAMTANFATAEDKAADPAAAIAAAEEARKAAADAGFEWRDTGKMIEDAQKAADAGEADKAIQIAEAAKLQGEMGLKQAELAKTAAPRF
jgi:hypothetical protein